MAIKITLDPVRGVVEENVAAGSSDALPQGLSPYRLPVTSLSANTTLGADSGGVYVITSSTGGAKTVTLPTAASSPGMLLTFRAGSDDAHIVTASQEVVRTQAIAFGPQSAPGITGSNGSRLTFPAQGSNHIGAAVGLLCDGKNWLILCGSGSLVLDGA